MAEKSGKVQAMPRPVPAASFSKEDQIQLEHGWSGTLYPGRHSVVQQEGENEERNVTFYETKTSQKERILSYSGEGEVRDGWVLT